METERLLADHDIRVTATRLLVANTLLRADHPLSQTEIEDELQTVDRSTVSRSVSLFLEKGMLHTVDDGSGVLKYEICTSESDENDDDAHVHFHCRRCGRTFCLHTVPVPEVETPSGFTTERASYVLTGLCPQCASRNPV